MEVKIDLGCGKRKKGPEWTGVDKIPFEGVDIVSDIIPYLKTLDPDSVDEFNMSQVFEHFNGSDRIIIMNEIYRSLKSKGKVFITCPCWANERAYGDPTHCWPPVSSWTFFYMNKEWRDNNAPHVDYRCDFDWSIAGTYDPNDQWLAYRNQETKSVLMARNINTTVDLAVTLVKK